MTRDTSITDERIQQRAFELWELRGCPEGYDADFWHQAERDLTIEGSRTGLSANTDSARSGSGSDGPDQR